MVREILGLDTLSILDYSEISPSHGDRVDMITYQNHYWKLI